MTTEASRETKERERERGVVENDDRVERSFSLSIFPFVSSSLSSSTKLLRLLSTKKIETNVADGAREAARGEEDAGEITSKYYVGREEMWKTNGRTDAPDEMSGLAIRLLICRCRR